MNRFLSLSAILAWAEVKHSYRRSTIGPFWITIGMAVQVSTIGLVFGLIFKSEMAVYLPYLATSIIVWGLITASLNEGALTFTSSEAMIRQLNLPHFVYVLKTVIKILLVAGHNIILLPLIFLIFSVGLSWNTLAVFPGLLILVLNLGWLAWLTGMASARFRDLPPVVSSLTTVAFYITPVIWYPELLGDETLAHLVLGLNPFYHLLQIVRLPLLGQTPTLENWLLASATAAIGWALTLILYKRHKSALSYWV